MFNKREEAQAMFKSTPSRRLPSLTALRAFESAARHQSLTVAARELCVSQSAISHQITNLEGDLGLSLFDRTTGKIILTEKGAQLARTLGNAFEMINSAWNLANRQPSVLRVLSSPTIGRRIILPHLQKTNYTVGETAIKLTLSLDFKTLVDGGFDLALVYGNGQVGKHEQAKLIFAEELMPMCSPEFKSRYGIRCIDDFGTITLLHGSSDHRDWQIWSESVKFDLHKVTQQLVFETLDVALQAASDGFGILMCDVALLARQPTPHNLVPAVESVAVSSGRGYYSIHQTSSENSDEITNFQDWLVEKVSDAKNGN